MVLWSILKKKTSVQLEDQSHLHILYYFLASLICSSCCLICLYSDNQWHEIIFKGKQWLPKPNTFKANTFMQLSPDPVVLLVLTSLSPSVWVCNRICVLSHTSYSAVFPKAFLTSQNLYQNVSLKSLSKLQCLTGVTTFYVKHMQNDSKLCFHLFKKKALE